MEAVYELRCRFGDDAQDVVASEHNPNDLQIVQGDDLILIPKSSASAFAEKLLEWISTGGRAA